MQRTCKAQTNAGRPCRSWAVGASGYCTMHDPARREANRRTQRAGGVSRSASRRAARQWAAAGESVAPAALPAILRGAIVAVLDGRLEPSQAQAVAALAKASLTIDTALAWEARIAALEAALGTATDPGALRRVK